MHSSEALASTNLSTSLSGIPHSLGGYSFLKLFLYSFAQSLHQLSNPDLRSLFFLKYFKSANFSILHLVLLTRSESLKLARVED